MNTYLIIFALILIIIAFWIAWTVYIVSGISGPSYQVVEQRWEYEIRDYDSYIVAEVEVEGNMKKALYAWFRQLAEYIFGGNISRTSIGVSVTLETMRATENIAMTVPVMDIAYATGKHIIAFTMPRKYTLETLPKPNNANIYFRTVENSRMAILRYNWYATEKWVEEKKKNSNNSSHEMVSFSRVK